MGIRFSSKLKYKSLSSILLIIVWGTYLCTGNLARVIAFQVNSGAINLTEVLLYLVSFFYIIIHLQMLKKLPVEIFFILAAFLVSFIIGAIRVNAIAIVPAIYTIRFLMYFLSSVAVGLGLYNIFHTRWRIVLDLYLGLFVPLLLISWILFIIFPQTADLLSFLQRFGITFNGDVHVNRLVSVFLDPNFFGNIAVFFLFLALWLYLETKQNKYIALTLWILGSIFFTFSRSTLLGLTIAGLGFLIPHLIQIIQGKVKIFFTLSIAIILICGLVFFSIKADAVYFYLARFINMRTDLSALHRYNDAVSALNLIFTEKNFILGVGYNFISYLGLTVLGSFDSSLLSLFLTHGFVLGTVVVSSVMFWVLKAKAWINKSFYYGVLIPYLLASVIMSFFGNLLFYQFWVLVILPLFMFFYFSKESKSKSSLNENLS